MRVRAIDSLGDWTFGRGQNDYKKNRDAVAQLIKTRLKSFLGNCFFSLDQGIDWFNILGQKDRISVQLAVSAVILNTQDVLEMIVLSVSLNSERRLTLQYKVNTIYGVITDVADLTAAPNYLLSESGEILTTEYGGFLES